MTPEICLSSLFPIPMMPARWDAEQFGRQDWLPNANDIPRRAVGVNKSGHGAAYKSEIHAMSATPRQDLQGK